jgi:hypothetical protein
MRGKKQSHSKPKKKLGKRQTQENKVKKIFLTPKNKDGKWKNLQAFLASKRSNRESGQIFFPSRNNFMMKGVLILLFELK